MTDPAPMLTLTPAAVRLADLRQILRGGLAVCLDRTVRPAVEAAAAHVARAAAADAPIYGINTGFGKLAQTRIAPADVARLQANLIRSHAAGVGAALPAPVVRLVLVLKLLSLGRGASGVRWAVIEQIEAFLAADVLPVIPAQGSVGASGDLAPLAHMALALMGEGMVDHAGVRKPAAAALQTLDRPPLVLGAKEGLALINGTQVSTALALFGLFDAWRCAGSALVTGALATDAAMGSTAPFHAEIQALRGQPGQIDAAAALRVLLADSGIRESHRQHDERVQDPYCIRCQPQVMGAVFDLLRSAGASLRIEANAVTDNPLVMADGSILSGGNFHAEPVAFAADQIALAMAEVGAIAQRRIALLVDPTLNFGLPAFLSPTPGLNSGFMIAEVTSAALMSENKQRAMPCSTDSTPTSADQEDHVSMACHGARRLLDMADNLGRILGIEWLAAAQGVELRTPLMTSTRLRAAIARLRSEVPPLGADRVLSGDIEAAAALVRGGCLTHAVGRSLLPQLVDM